ncbi:tandem-95 repeat protein, partial [Candidatus Woesearchaeota archaeon]|nr:tandem-95 repeat protein [Candidatus Woesearchaeota archaeon]
TGLRFVTFTVWDSFSANANSNLITLNITPVNDRPIFTSSLPNITFAEDTYNDTLNLLSYSFDVDGDDMNWSIVTSQSNIENLTIIINNNTGQVNITSDLDFYGIRWIYFNVSDPSNTYDISTNVTINVTPVNDPPYYTANIPTIIFPEDTIFNSLNLSNYTADVDDLDLNWTVNYGLSVINNLTININNATGIVTITPDGNFTGLRLVTFTVWDSFNSTANSNLITINVTPVNDPPTFITTINNVTFDEDTFNDSINLQSHFFDVDGDLLNWSINTSLSNITNLTINISSSGLVNITADLDWYGKRWVTFVAIDTYNEFAVSNNVSIEVFAVNDPPRQIAVIPDIVFPEDTVFRNMNLSDYFFDVEGSYINYTINTALSSIQNISFTIINTTGNITITPDGNFTNTRWIYFNAIDNESASTLSTRINIDVTPVNDPPASLAVMPNITVWENDFNTSITLDNYVWDVDNNDWELSWGFISSSGHLLGSVIWSGLTQIANISGQLEWNGYEPLVLNVCDFEYCRNTTIWVLVLGKDYPIISSYNLSNRTTSWWTFNDNFTTTATEVLQENSTIDFLMDITDNDFNDSMNLTWFVYDLFDNNFSGFYKLGNDSDKDMSITFDWHAAGDYLVRLVANDLLNHTSELTWNIFVRNKNRAPNKPTILFPPNNHFYTYNNTNWNWTLVTDPDDEAGKTAYDIYDISYRLIIANTTELIETMLNIDSDNLDTSINTSGNATIFVDRRFDNNTNNYTLIDPEQLPSGIYHAILIANDSRDFNYSDIVDFEVDLPPQVDIYRIFRNPAKIDFHNVTINWTAQDDNGIVDAYINVTNPDNTLLGQYRSSIKLLPINMTQNGTYTITAFAIDSKNSTALVTRNFSVVYDIWPPSIRLLNPRLYLLVPGVNATVGGTGTVIFDYNVTDLSPVDYCSLYLQSKFVTIMIPWSVFGNRTDIYDGLYGYKGLDVEGTGQTNRFVVSGLVRGDYTWNVYCIDDESNGGYSVYNGSFELDIPDATINIIEPELGTEVSQTIPRYGVELDVDKYEVNEDDIVTLKGKIRSTGEQLTSVELSTNVSWIILDETYIKTLSGEEDLVFFVNTNYVASGNHTVQFIVRSNEVSYKKAATIIVKGRKMAEVELPGINRLSLTKRIEIDGDNMIVKLIFKNVGYGEISKFSAVDELLNGKVINYDPKLMELDKFNRMVINVPALGLNSNYTVEYTAKDLNIDTLTKPIVSGNIYTIFDQEVNVPLEMNFVIQRTVIKERLLSSSLVLFILMILGIKLYAKKGGAI